MTSPSPLSRDSALSNAEVRRIDLDATVRAAGEARAFVREVLAEWGYVDAEPDATLAVSELVTNAVIHAHSPAQVELINMDGAIQLRVCDHEPTPPHVVEPSPDNPHGRGMMLVDSVCETWGIEERPPGKVIWLDIRDH